MNRANQEEWSSLKTLVVEVSCCAIVVWAPHATTKPCTTVALSLPCLCCSVSFLGDFGVNQILVKPASQWYPPFLVKHTRFLAYFSVKPKLFDYFLAKRRPFMEPISNRWPTLCLFLFKVYIEYIWQRLRSKVRYHGTCWPLGFNLNHSYFEVNKHVI